MSAPFIHVETMEDGRVIYLEPSRDFWRYLFAGIAMQGMLTNEITVQRAYRDGTFPAEEIIAHDAIVQADALLAELEREKEEAGNG